MCGIVGVVSTNLITDYNWIASALEITKHRGPDFSNIWNNKNAVLGHNRLSIIDLSEKANQPMDRKDLQVVVAFNGEVYNFLEIKEELIKYGFKFLTNSDTEVIICAYKKWGIDFVKKLNGMFAIALLDYKFNKFYLIRDRVGKKPLYYTFIGNELRFASELKGLLADRDLERKLDYTSLNFYLKFGFVPGRRSILKNFFKLEPATVLYYDLNNFKVRIWKYWSLPEPEYSDKINENNIENLLSEFYYLLSDAVKKRLIADVPIGLLLSGGLDSSLITAIASELNHNIRTYSVIFPKYEQYNEAKYSKQIAEYFGTQHTELAADDISPEVMEKLSLQYDEPIIDSSIIPTYLVSKLVRTHCTVALGGDGGDELFGGYSYYQKVLRFSKFNNKIPKFIKLFLKSLLKNVSLGLRGRRYLEVLLASREIDKVIHTLYFSSKEIEKLIGYAEDVKLEYKAYNNIIDTLTRMDFYNYLPEDILIKVDRASMLNSLEIRAPLLDYRIVEFAYKKIPYYLKVDKKKGKKIFLKLFAKKILPKDFDFNRKHGFSLPLSEWLRDKRNKWHNYFREILLSSDFFNKTYIQKLINNHNYIFIDNSERLFGLVLFELWRKVYKISL